MRTRPFRPRRIGLFLERQPLESPSPHPSYNSLKPKSSNITVFIKIEPAPILRYSLVHGLAQIPWRGGRADIWFLPQTERLASDELLLGNDAQKRPAIRLPDFNVPKARLSGALKG